VSNSRQISNIALIGFMGTGKSTVGRLVADQLRFDFLDTDELIEARAANPLRPFSPMKARPPFARMKKIVEELSARRQHRHSTGGGLGANEANLASLKQHALVACLWASPEKIWERVRSQTHRPLLKEADPLAKIRQLLASREPFYKQATRC